MKYGLSGTQFDELIQILATYPEIEEAVLFGSRALGTYKEASDVDIALKGKQVTAALAAKLKFHLEEETYQPFFYDFVAYPTVTNEALKGHIDGKGVCIYRRGWREFRLEELGILQRGRSRHRPRYAFHLFGGQYPFIQTGEIREARKYITHFEQTYNEAGLEQSKLWPKGTLCITIAANIAELAILSFDACFPDIVLGFIPNEQCADLNFIYYTLTHFQRELKHAGEGSVQDNINLGTFQDVLFPIPPLPEQKAIASVLSSLDDKIELLHRQNKIIEAMAETLFRQWFVEEAQEEWKEVKIKDFDVVVTDYVANGSFASLASNVTYRSEPDFAILIRLKDYNNNFKGDFVYVDEKAYNFLDKSKLFGGEIIISNVGQYSGTVFRCPRLQWPMTLGPNSIVIKSKFNNFFYLFFSSKYGQFLLDGIISGSAQPKFNKTAFRNLEISYPDVDYLFRFEDMISNYFKRIDFNLKQIQTLEKLRDTLLPKLMSGEVRVEYSEN